MSKNDNDNLNNFLTNRINKEIKQDLKANTEVNINNIINLDSKREKENDILEIYSSINGNNKNDINENNEKDEKSNIDSQSNSNQLFHLTDDEKKKNTNDSLINSCKEENEIISIELNKEKVNIKTSQDMFKSNINLINEKLHTCLKHSTNTSSTANINQNNNNDIFNSTSYINNSNNANDENNNNDNDSNRQNNYSDIYLNTSNKKKIQLNVSVLKNSENENYMNNINSSNFVLDIDLLSDKNDITKLYHENTYKSNNKDFSKIVNSFNEFESYKLNDSNSNLYYLNKEDNSTFSFINTINNFKNEFESKNKNIFESVSKKGLMLILTIQEVFINKTKKILCNKCNGELYSFNNINNVFKDILKLKIEKQTNEIYMTNFLQRLKKDFVKNNLLLKEKINEKNMVINNLNEEKKTFNDIIRKYEDNIIKMKNDQELKISRFKINIQNSLLNFTDFVFQLLFKIYSLFCEKNDKLQFLINRLKHIQLSEKKIDEKKKKNKISTNNNDDYSIKSKKIRKKNKENYTSSSSWNSSKEFFSEKSKSSENSSMYLSNELCYSDLTHMNTNNLLNKKKINKFKNKRVKAKNLNHILMKRSVLNENKMYSNSSDVNEESNLNHVKNINKDSVKKISFLQKTNAELIKKLKKYKKKYLEEVKKNKTLKFLLTNKEEEIEQVQNSLKNELEKKEIFYENKEKKNIKEINELRSLIENHELSNKNLMNKNKEYNELNDDLKKKLDFKLSIEKELNNKLYEFNIIFEKEREKNSFLLSENIKLKNVILQFNNIHKYSNVDYFKNKDFVKYNFNNLYENNEHNLYNDEENIYKVTSKGYFRNNENKNVYDNFDYKNYYKLNEKIYKENYLNYPNRMYDEKEKSKIRKSSLVHNKNKYHYDHRKKMYDTFFNNNYVDYYKNDYNNAYRNFKLYSSCYSDNSVDVRMKKRKNRLNSIEKKIDINYNNEEEKRKRKIKEKEQEKEKGKKKEKEKEKKKIEKETISNQIKNDILNFDENNYKKIINNITKEEKEIEKIKEEDLYSIFMQNWKESNIDNNDYSLVSSNSFISNLNESGVFINNNSNEVENLENNKSENLCKSRNKIEKMNKQDNESTKLNYGIKCSEKKSEYLNNNANNKDINRNNFKYELNEYENFAKNGNEEIANADLGNSNKNEVIKKKDINFEEEKNIFNLRNENGYNRNSSNNHINNLNDNINNNEEKNQAIEDQENEILMTYETYKKNKEKFMYATLKMKSNEHENKNKLMKNRKNVLLSDILNKEGNINNYKKDEEIDNENLENFQNIENNINDLRESTIYTAYHMNHCNDISLNNSIHEIYKSLIHDYDNKNLNFFQTSKSIIDPTKKNSNVVCNNGADNSNKDEFCNYENTTKLEKNKINNVFENNTVFKEGNYTLEENFKNDLALVEENNKDKIENDKCCQNNILNDLNNKKEFKNTYPKKQKLHSINYDVEPIINTIDTLNDQSNNYFKNFQHPSTKISFKNEYNIEVKNNSLQNNDSQQNEKNYTNTHNFLNMEQSKVCATAQKKEISENKQKKKNSGDRGVLSRILRKI
ncbi:conserved Plasmodium protein, unknown function [Plasmodium relictum]|uniref:Uncharacterized protein n=1 Tax=Plasmodium relictum TaxID=85471 RepID=A0A1J1H354_PLARL|nr:conserved Plasmodium protein, unknown function [Plasmodium relictum]CRG99356.1 conserved Plasmodium protein, unknown function [Plasmodium relictum]